MLNIRLIKLTISICLLILSASGCSTHSPSLPIYVEPEVLSKASDKETSSAETTDLKYSASVSNEIIKPITLDSVSTESVLGPELTVDLWQRMRIGFELNITDLPSIVDDQREWYLNNPSYLTTVFNRSRPFLYHVVEELELANLPLELALLPVVESTYDPLAYSSSHAAGLWQFIPSTGRQYGLTRNRWYEGRRDVVKSTSAAIAYLSYLNQRFDGDWLLALAAYNAGEGSVSKAIQKNKKLGLPADFWHLKLPKETRNYVPQLLALSALVKSSEQFAIELPNIPNEKYFETIEISNQIALSLVLDISGIDRSLFTQLNAAYRRSITPPEGTYSLVLPKGNSAKVRHFIETSNPSTWIPHTEYMVVSGDTLSHIAIRFDSPVSAIRKRNGLNTDRLKIGQILLIPHSEGDVVTMTQVNRYETLNHLVSSGDSLSSLALKYRTSIKSIRHQNGLKSNIIKIGQTLEILVPGRASMSAKIRKLSYKVRKGDSLYLIGKRFSVSVSDIKKWNRIDDKKYLQPGQRLTLFINPMII